MNSSIYFHRLLDALLETQVTDRTGSILSVEMGVEQLVASISSGNTAVGTTRPKILLVGNGGSAAIASHVQNDLCKAVGARAMIFNEPSLLTALANDINYASAFEYLVDLWAEPGDTLLAISSSGMSENILRAVSSARDRGCLITTFSAFLPTNSLRRLGDVNFYISTKSYGLAELAHSTLLHYITDQAMAQNVAAQAHQSRPRNTVDGQRAGEKSK